MVFSTNKNITNFNSWLRHHFFIKEGVAFFTPVPLEGEGEGRKEGKEGPGKEGKGCKGGKGEGKPVGTFYDPPYPLLPFT